MFFFLNKFIIKYFRNIKERRKNDYVCSIFNWKYIDKCKFKINLVDDCFVKYLGICYKCIVDMYRYIKYVFFFKILIFNI